MSRCPLCPGKHACVQAVGPDDCGGYLALGEAPGYEENKKLEPFVGKTGREVNDHYFPLAGWRRPNIRIDNAISCFPDRAKGKLDLKKEPDRLLLESCAEHHLYPDLERLQPKLIVPMGAFACRALDPDIDLDLQHGMPVMTQWGQTFPMWHPSSGLHEPKKMLHVRTDWIRLRKYLTGKLHLEIDQYAGQEFYKVVSDASELQAILQGCHDLPLAIDTEARRGGQPFCLTLSAQPGTGFLILADNEDTLRALQAELDQWMGPILFHNWLYDGPQVARMGLRFPIRRIRDTMVLSFHLGNLPQGLKALSYRELGMKMLDFDDLVTPFSSELVMDYYRQMYAEEWPTAEPQLKRKGEDFKLYKPQNLHTKLKRFFTDYAKNNDKDPFAMWTDNWGDEQKMVEDRLGEWPGKCISHAWDKDKEAVIRYACLSTDSKVSTPDGYKSIGWMVRNQYTGLVDTYNPESDQIETRHVTGHYRIKQDEKIQWKSIHTTHTVLGKWGMSGTRYTPDHRLLTPRGMRPISELAPRDQIYLPEGRLNSQEWQIVFGSLLGDGSVSQRNAGGWANLRFSHNIRQKGYLDWKASMLTNLHPTVTPIDPCTRMIEGKEAVALAHFQLSSKQHPELNQIRWESYTVPGQGKNVGTWVHGLNQLGLAVWYQDDGTLVGGRTPRLYTLGFVKDDVDWLVSVLMSNFGIEATSYQTDRPGQWAIQVPVAGCDRFFGLIAPLVHPSMQYKLPEEWRGLFHPPAPIPPEGLVLSTVDCVYDNPQSKGRRGATYYSYCIDVEETHNFLTMGEVAKNCRDADATLRLWPLLQWMRRRVRKAPQEKWSEGWAA